MLHQALRQLYLLIQQKGQPNFEYYQRFQNNVDLITHLGSSFGFHDSLIKGNLAKIGETLADADDAQKSKAYSDAIQQYLAAAYLMGLDRK